MVIDETMWSPEKARLLIVYVIAAAPEATARAAVPPSRAATLLSRASVVVLVSLLYMLPSFLRANLSAASSQFLKTYDVVR